MADISVGSVSVTVVPDARGIDRKLESALLPAADAVGQQMGQAIADKIASAIGDGVTKGGGGAIPPARTTGDAVGRTFADSIKSRIQAALKTLPDVKLDADSTEADGKIAGIREELTALSEQRIGVDMSADDALARIAVLREQLDELGKTAPIDVKVDTAGASAQLAALQAQVDRVTGSGSKELQESGSEGGDLLIRSIVGGALAASPLLVGAMAAIGATAIGAIGVAISKGDPQLDAAWGKFSQRGIKDARAAALPMAQAATQALGQVTVALPGLERDAHGVFSAAAQDVQPFVAGITSLADNAIPGVTRGLKTAQPVIDAFDKSLGGVGTAVGQAFEGLTHDASGVASGVTSVMSILSSTISTAGRVIGDVAGGIGTDISAIQAPVTGLLGVLRSISSPALDVGAAGAIIAAKWNPLGSIIGGASTSLVKFASVGPDVDAADVSMQGLRATAGTLGDKLGSVASVLGGPWGIAIGAAVAAAGPLISDLLHVADASDAVKLSASGLATVMEREQGATDKTVVSWIRMQDESGALKGSLDALHVSAQTVADAVVGSNSAWGQLVTQLNAAGKAAGVSVSQTGKLSVAEGEYTTNLHTGQQTLNSHTAAVVDHTNKVIDSTKAQQQQYQAELQQIAQDNKWSGALDQLSSKTSKLTAEQQSAATSVLQLGISSQSLNSTLYTAEVNYNNAATAAKGYGAAVQAASGNANSLFDANTQLDSAELGLSTALKAAKGNLDGHTQASIAARQAVTSLSQASIQQATALFQSEVATKGADAAYSDANKTLATQKERFEEAAISAGGSKTAVDALAAELFRLPDKKSLEILAKDYASSVIEEVVEKAHKGATMYINIKANTASISGAPGHLLTGQARGGIIPGVDRGYDSVLVPMRPQEGVLVPEAARALGGASGINRINRAAEAGRLSMRGYASGGVVEPPSYAGLVPQTSVSQSALDVIVQPSVSLRERVQTINVYPPVASAEQVAAATVRALNRAGTG